MRAKHFGLSFLLCAIAIADGAVAQSGMRWQASLETAKRVAAQTNRLVLVHFWTESCGPCMRMEREVFSRPEVAAAIEANFVPVKINAQRLPQIAREFGVNALPTDLIITPKGDVVDRKTGGADAAQYVAAMGQVAARVRGPSNQVPAAQAAAGPAFAPQGMVAANQGYPPPYQQPATAGAPGSPYPPATAIPNYGGGMAQGYPGPSQPPAAGQAAPTRAQPWQAEAGQWNPGGTGSVPGYSAAVPPAQPAPSMNHPSEPGGHPNQGASPWAGQPSGRGQPSLSGSNISPPSAPSTDARPSNPPFGLDGYCPVVLSEKERWVRGDPRYGVIHRGKTYLFSGPDEAKRFFADPDRYAPVLSGIDVVVAVDENRQVPGKREFGVWYEGRMYLFSNEASFRKFDQDPGRYSAAATQVAQASSRRPVSRSESPYDRRPMF